MDRLLRDSSEYIVYADQRSDIAYKPCFPQRYELFHEDGESRVTHGAPPASYTYQNASLVLIFWRIILSSSSNPSQNRVKP
jgi:hypothetical protein